jgi:ribosomal protein S14
MAEPTDLDYDRGWNRCRYCGEETSVVWSAPALHWEPYARPALDRWSLRATFKCGACGKGRSHDFAFGQAERP